jgi:histidinol-phosphate aminotransferase
VVIANPNAPTGKTISLDDIRRILESNRDYVCLIDEAYVDFGTESAATLVKEYDNLLVVQTFSKSRSLAGGRLGFAIASSELIEGLEKIKYSTNPYSINRLTLLAGKAAIEDEEYFEECRQKIIETREYTTIELEKRGFTVIPSKANFVFAKLNSLDGESLYLKLKEKGILVRHFKKERIKDYLRITIGKREEMERLIDVIDELAQEPMLLGEENI